MKITIEGSYAPTALELKETSKFLDSIIESWPGETKSKESKAVIRFANKLHGLVRMHDLHTTG